MAHWGACRWGFILLIVTVVGLESKPSWSGVCYTGHPSPECDGVVITEFFIASYLAVTERHHGRATISGSLNFGYLHNVGSRSGIGAGIRLGFDAHDGRLGLMGRYRRWVGYRMSIDVSPGFYFRDRNEEQITGLYPVGSLDLSVNYSDRVALVLGADAFRNSSGSTSLEPYFGFRFGTWLAPITALGFAVCL